MLPYTDGIRATKAIRSLTLEKQPVIIAITAFAEPEEKQACFFGWDERLSYQTIYSRTTSGYYPKMEFCLILKKY